MTIEFEVMVSKGEAQRRENQLNLKKTFILLQTSDSMNEKQKLVILTQ